LFELFTDRIVITSSGGLVADLSEEDFFKCRSMPRNRELMRVFRDMELVEQIGSGMSRILKAYDRSERTISRELREYQDAGLLRREGSRKSGSWIVR